ncbi:MAG TPA: CehA/McbA family metallohydrolase [Gemmataceae bacterium]|nr:CehA/McbA family metallohydrolase [Gemmataceae bacterium]
MTRIPRGLFRRSVVLLPILAGLCLPAPAQAQALEVIDVEGQPLAANVNRLLQALDFLGAPLPADETRALQEAIKAQDAAKIQRLLDPRVLVVVTINPESRVKAARGPGKVALQQGGYVPLLLKVINDSTVTAPLRIFSPQAGPVYGSPTLPAGIAAPKERFLDIEMFNRQPMTANLSGLKVEYALALAYSSEAGKREATLIFDVGQGTQDLGFRAEVPILFEVRPGIPVKLSVKDFDGQPTVGRFTFRDRSGHVYPPRPKRLAPDFFFQDQIYRADGDTVLLPPGLLTMEYGRGPEYRLLKRDVTIPAQGEARIEVKLERWINPMDYGFYSGDHHIHAAGCAHYTSPTEGVFARDMFLHVKGEGLNVGCNLTWGPCFEFQRQFFEPTPHKLSEPFCVLKYDIEVSGFGSQALGHVCLLNLRDQTYPGSDGTKTKGWPTWTTPLMRWAKQQGAVTGYAHSASGLQVNPQAAARRLLQQLDADRDGRLTPAEAAKGLLPDDFARIDSNGDGAITQAELVQSLARVSGRLPNLAIPELNGIGAQEVFVTAAQGLCDFISAMDTQRVAEWNCWYHIMNCGLPLKVSGETDFPCISGSRVGEGRVYVQLGKIDRIDFTAWCEGLAKGRSYVSDGYAHALEFRVNGQTPGGEVALDRPGMVTIKAKVAFAREMPLGTAKGGTAPLGDKRLVEVVVNGQAVASQEVPADDQPHDLNFEVKIDRSSWVALRHFPQMHTNPVTVTVAGKPIRASRRSALWCAECIEQLWRARSGMIAPHERAEAQRTFQRAVEFYRKIAAEAPEGS